MHGFRFGLLREATEATLFGKRFSHWIIFAPLHEPNLLLEYLDLRQKLLLLHRKIRILPRLALLTPRHLRVESSLATGLLRYLRELPVFWMEPHQPDPFWLWSCQAALTSCRYTRLSRRDRVSACLSPLLSSSLIFGGPAALWRVAESSCGNAGTPPNEDRGRQSAGTYRGNQ